MKNDLFKNSKTLAIAIATLLFSTNVNAKHTKNQLQIATYDYKCHVELLGGGEVVHFVNSASKDLNVIASSIMGKNTIIPFSKKSAVIYNVVECVIIYSEFQSKVSQRLDDQTVR
ncbi:MAG: TapY2 family type IVa secretion system protein [Colwellia sp.]|nr:TapY2 family type IVa secretion system protein [Colwellia sp.]